MIWKTNDDGSEDVDEENSQSEESCSGSDSEEFMDNELLDADDDDQSEMFGDEDEDEDEEGEEDEADEDYEEDEGEDKQPKKKVRFNSDMKVGAQTNVKETKSIRNRLDATRVLTEDDFKLIAKLKAAKAEQLKDPKFRSKKNATENNLDDEQADSAISTYTIDPSTLAAGVKTEKETKIERIKHMLANKTENKFVHEGHKGGLTNKEKLRKKNYVMVRKGKRSVANKSRKSNSTLRYEKLHKVHLVKRISLFFLIFHNFSCRRRIHLEGISASAEELKIEIMQFWHFDNRTMKRSIL